VRRLGLDRISALLRVSTDTICLERIEQGRGGLPRPLQSVSDHPANLEIIGTSSRALSSRQDSRFDPKNKCKGWKWSETNRVGQSELERQEEISVYLQNNIGRLSFAETLMDERRVLTDKQIPSQCSERILPRPSNPLLFLLLQQLSPFFQLLLLLLISTDLCFVV
jgi:hypothetical protein